ncbi:MAG: GTPase Era [bacterium]
MDAFPFRVGYVAIVGRPNAGKSTLLNQLLNHYLAIVTPKPQTTRQRILGILNGPNYQVLLIDTPGILDPKYTLHKFMKEETKLALDDSDLILMLIDATQPEFADLKLLVGRQSLVAINKIDAIPKQNLLQLAGECTRANNSIKDLLMISARTGDGIAELKQKIVDLLPLGAPLYPQTILSERPERFFVAEFIREAVFNYYGAEIPYSTTVVIDEFREQPNRKVYIRAIIYVEKESQKGILIGERGWALKKVGKIARNSIEKFLGRPVYLELWIKVAQRWRQNINFIRQNLYS